MEKHIHIYFPPRKQVRDQAPGSVPPSDMNLLVAALHEALAAREGRTNDIGFDESKVKRDEGGKFSAQGHTNLAQKHTEAAAAAGKGTPAHAAHTAAAEAHTLAAQHITAKTGWAAYHSQKAIQASQKAQAAGGPASLAQLEGIASNPQASVEERAQAVSQLDKMEKAANVVAASPHAIPKYAVGGTAIKPMPKQGLGFKPTITSPMGPGNPLAGVGADQPQGAKPTSAVNTPSTKVATHELLSSGHPFSIDELMKATGAKSQSTLMTALSDLKSEKYAGKLGKLNIVKRPDGMYHVEKAAAIKSLPSANKLAGPSGGDAAIREKAHQTAISKYLAESKNMPPAVKVRQQELLSKVPTANLVANPHYEHAQAEKQARLDVFRKSLPGGKLPLPGGKSLPSANKLAGPSVTPSKSTGGTHNLAHRLSSLFGG